MNLFQTYEDEFKLAVTNLSRLVNSFKNRPSNQYDLSIQIENEIENAQDALGKISIRSFGYFFSKKGVIK